MDPDYNSEFDEPCPYCGNDETRYRDCGECDDGWIDEYDSDPLWFDEGDGHLCRTCNGTGVQAWCPACGNDPRTKAHTAPAGQGDTRNSA